MPDEIGFMKSGFVSNAMLTVRRIESQPPLPQTTVGHRRPASGAPDQGGRREPLQPAAPLHNAAMPNFSTLLKDEIARVARKELRGEVAGLKKATSAQRTEIAALKRRTQELEKALRALAKANRRSATAAPPSTTPKATRFSAKGLASQRKRLALSAEDCGLLVGASGQSIYNWESAKARPRELHLASIASLKSLGKKEALARLEVLRGS